MDIAPTVNSVTADEKADIAPKMSSVAADEKADIAPKMGSAAADKKADIAPRIGHQLGQKPRTQDIRLDEDLSFVDLGLGSLLIKGLSRSGFEKPSPIQLAAIPYGRCGLDLVVQAKSGTGKTCVFSIIALEAVDIAIQSPQVLMLTPTREIALQVEQVVKAIGSEIPGLVCHCSIGGLSVKDDKYKVNKAHVVIGTPGRVKQLMEIPALYCSSIRLLVLDEADKLLEDSFQEQINWIYSGLPDSKQVIAASATYKEEMVQHLCNYMHNPTFVRLNSNDPVLLGVRQYKKEVATGNLPNENYDNKVSALIDILSRCHFQQCLVFSNLITRAENLSKLMVSRGWPTTHIAGCQEQGDRIKAITRLKSYDCRILISTDLTSRGIDADRIDLVINLDLPFDCETYLHRVGRAGRFGSNGAAITLYTQSETSRLDKMASEIDTSIQVLPAELPLDFIHNPTMEGEQKKTVEVYTFQIRTDGSNGGQNVTAADMNAVSCSESEGSLAEGELHQESNDGGTKASADNLSDEAAADLEVEPPSAAASTSADSATNVDSLADESRKILLHRVPFVDLDETVRFVNDPDGHCLLLDTTTYHKRDEPQACGSSWYKVDDSHRHSAEKAEGLSNVTNHLSKLTVDASRSKSRSNSDEAQVEETRAKPQLSDHKPPRRKANSVSKSVQAAGSEFNHVETQVRFVGHGLVSDCEPDTQLPGVGSGLYDSQYFSDSRADKSSSKQGKSQVCNHVNYREDGHVDSNNYQYVDNNLYIPTREDYVGQSRAELRGFLSQEQANYYNYYNQHYSNYYSPRGQALEEEDEYYCCREEYHDPDVYYSPDHVCRRNTRRCTSCTQRGGNDFDDSLRRTLDTHYKQAYTQYSYIRRMARRN